MTGKEALELIKAKMGMADSPLRNQLALAALNGAVMNFNLLGEYKWNQQRLTATLESGEATYKLTSLFPNNRIRKVYDERIWFTAERRSVEIVEREEFNTRKRGVTSTGKPVIATIHSKDGYIEFYPTPDDNYAIWLMAALLITDFDEYTQELHYPILYMAVMSAADLKTPEGLAGFNWAKAMWDIVWPKIEMHTKSYLTWSGDTVTPDEFALGSEPAVGYPIDSTNVVGEL